MLKQCIFGLLLAATSFISYAEEAPSSDSQNTAYIVDNLYTFMHSGPSKNYRILGSVDAGTQVMLLSDEDNGYFKIRDDKDREGWVEAKFVTENAVCFTFNVVKQRWKNYHCRLHYWVYRF